MIDQDRFFYVMEPTRYFDLALDHRKFPDPSRPGDPIIILDPESFCEPVIEKLLQTKVNTVDNDRFACMCSHVVLL
jgi:hypothetical protein